MPLSFKVREPNDPRDFRFVVLGVGGAGGNAVNNMIASGLEGVDFVVANTDEQSLASSKAKQRVQLGANIAEGQGAAAQPDIGRAAAEASLEEIMGQLRDAHMVFITAGMGGGTGTGATPVIARALREAGILTVGVVTKPFAFEGDRRMRIAEMGIAELRQYVHTLIVIPNQNLFRVANDSTTFAQAFAMADDMLGVGVRGITDLIFRQSVNNVALAEIETFLSEPGTAMIGTGDGTGEGRARMAADMAISNPVLDYGSIKGARGVLINIAGGPDMMLFEVETVANDIRAEVGPDASVLFGSTVQKDLEGHVRVFVLAKADYPPRNEDAIVNLEAYRAKPKTKRSDKVKSKSQSQWTIEFNVGGEPVIVRKSKSAHGTSSERFDRRALIRDAINLRTIEIQKAIQVLGEVGAGIGHNSIPGALDDRALPLGMLQEVATLREAISTSNIETQKLRIGAERFLELGAELLAHIPIENRTPSSDLRDSIRNVSDSNIKEFSKAFYKRLGDLSAYALWTIVGCALIEIGKLMLLG